MTITLADGESRSLTLQDVEGVMVLLEKPERISEMVAALRAKWVAREAQERAARVEAYLSIPKVAAAMEKRRRRRERNAREGR